MKKIYILVIFFTIFRTLSVGAPPLSHPEITKKIALTFDACMTGGMLKRVEAGTEKPLFNEAIVAYLHQERIPATIFITGLWAKQYPEAVKEIATDPFLRLATIPTVTGVLSKTAFPFHLCRITKREQIFSNHKRF